MSSLTYIFSFLFLQSNSIRSHFYLKIIDLNQCFSIFFLFSFSNLIVNESNRMGRREILTFLPFRFFGSEEPDFQRKRLAIDQSPIFHDLVTYLVQLAVFLFLFFIDHWGTYRQAKRLHQRLFWLFQIAIDDANYFECKLCWELYSKPL